MYLLSAIAVDVARGDRALLEGISFSVAAGDLLHIKGRNGAGKSSLIEVLVGLRRPQRGRVEGLQSQQMHWVGHRNALQPDLTLAENLRSWCSLQKLKTANVSDALEHLGLRALRHRPARTLSMGQKRRAALARLLISPRPLWILDEPLSGLDTQGTLLLGKLMNAHLADQGGIVVTSHQPLPGRIARVSVLDLA